MDFAYSPHREVGGTLHLHSPTHPHSYRVDGFPSIKQIRRSLSRSPSKASRFTLHSNSPSGSPQSPLSPLALSRAFSPNSKKDQYAPELFPFSPLQDTPATTKKSKPSLRRLGPLRTSPRKRPTPRRALSDTLNQANKSPSSRRRSTTDEDNMDEDTASVKSAESDTQASIARLEFNDGPIKFEFAKPKGEATDPVARCLQPAKSSPLKRSDGIMNLDQASLGSPVAKRRSLHGGPFGDIDNVFDHAPTEERGSSEQDREMTNYSFTPSSSSPLGPRRASPIRKASLRKSTLNRYSTGSGRPRFSQDAHEFLAQSPSASRSAKPRISLDSGIAMSPSPAESPFRRSKFGSSHGFHVQKRSVSGPAITHQPHPLSNALTPSSSCSSLSDNDDSPSHMPPPAPAPQRQTIAEVSRPPISFSRSLPIGAARPAGRAQVDFRQSGSFATPDHFRMARPLPAAFMSTGLISKKNRNVEAPAAGGAENYTMPDTPSKRVSFPPVTSSTPFQKSTFGKSTMSRPEFGTPSTPFSSHAVKATPISFGQGVSVFGSRCQNPGLERRGSFVSIDGDDHLQSPSGTGESQFSNDEFPPTPTKQNSARGSKDNSLRSNLFGRRASLGPDTFTPPTPEDIPSPKFSKSKSFPRGSAEMAAGSKKGLFERSPNPFRNSPGVDTSSPFGRRTSIPSCPSPLLNHSLKSSSTPSPADGTEKVSSPAVPTPSLDRSKSPQTPQGSYTPPDASRLSISAHANRRGSIPFNASLNGSLAFPPATPTASRDQMFHFGNGQPVAPITGLTKNDVDTSLTARFENVKPLSGDGEFSQVFLVDQPIGDPMATSPSSRTLAKRWVVKKSKKPYTGVRDRERKMQEVEIIRALRGNEHIIEFTNYWEEHNHLYIQTEYCENGNLKTFLSETGDKARLDDFRIWKILLELSSVSFMNCEPQPKKSLLTSSSGRQAYPRLWLHPP